MISAFLLAAALAAPPAKPDPAAKDKAADVKMPLTGLAPSKILPNLCLYRYRVSTSSVECQAFVDQGLGFYYSYVWMEAARSFETALKHDPDCAFAYWGLSRALETWGKGNHTDVLKKAKELLPRTNQREHALI